MGYGLSMFDSFRNSIEKYRKLYGKFRPHQRKQFIQDKGRFIVLLKLTENDGIADEPDENNFGHFTFHEYHHTELEKKDLTFYNIFLDNGEFNI